MDSRFIVYGMDAKRDDLKVILHPTASHSDVRLGTSTDDFDLTPFVTTGTQTFFEFDVTLTWNYELFGVNQPKAMQIIELRAQGKPLWVGVIDSIGGYTVSRGDRLMNLTARSRDSFDIWKTSKRVTAMYPLVTEYSVIAGDIGTAVGLQEGEILLPVTAYTTVHPSTQMSDMSAWEMLTALLVPAGKTQFIDGLGRLRVAQRQLVGRASDLVLDDFIKVTASRSRPPTTRVVIKWLDPTATKVTQQGRKLADCTLTMGFFTASISKKLLFSVDGTQRAENTYLKVEHSIQGLLPTVFDERNSWTQDTAAGGTLFLQSYYYTTGLIAMALAVKLAALLPDGVLAASTVPKGRITQAAAEVALLTVMMSIGTGVYEIWGTPYDIVNARNTTEAYDSSAPPWMDNPQNIETDFVVSEAHAQQFATTELIYQAKAANKTGGTIPENMNLEYGDLIEFPDGSRMFLEDIRRSVARGAENTLELSGFLL